MEATITTRLLSFATDVVKEFHPDEEAMMPQVVVIAFTTITADGADNVHVLTTDSDLLSRMALSEYAYLYHKRLINELLAEDDDEETL